MWALQACVHPEPCLRAVNESARRGLGKKPRELKETGKLKGSQGFWEGDKPKGRFREQVILAVFRGDISASLCRRKS